MLPDDHPTVQIKNEVRSFYAAGVKSGKNGYSVSKVEFISDDDWDHHSNQFSVRMKAGRHLRKLNAEISTNRRPAPRAQGQSILDFGRQLYNGGARAQFTSGNCAAMAAVAAAIAVDVFHYQRAWVYRGSITSPGDHVFCILSMSPPS
jgi:hypothetical protein